ncbi:MAG: hydroxyacylglutathione hydrolase C-terminal domain-containing protein, partial [Bdellovibrionota bacterium]
KALFCGDVIFSLGCGKLFEGNAQEMWTTLSRLRDLPEDTLVYCAHEYTLENAAYAFTVDPHNPRLVAMFQEGQARRARGESTVPSLLADEKAANPFLRPESVEIRAAVGVTGDEPLWKVFGAVRAHKDEWDSRN